MNDQSSLGQVFWEGGGAGNLFVAPLPNRRFFSVASGFDDLGTDAVY